MPIRFIAREDSSALDDFGVSDLEDAKHYAHTAAWVSPICGYDQYMDQHYALQQHQVAVDSIVDNLEALGNKWHCNRVGYGSIDVYAVEPTGDAVQLDGYLSDKGTDMMETWGCFNTTNVLFHLARRASARTSTPFTYEDDAGAVAAGAATDDNH